MSASCLPISLNKSCTLVCRVRPAAGVVGSVKFYNIDEDDLGTYLGQLNQTESGCSVVGDSENSYPLQCGSGTDKRDSATKEYDLKIDVLRKHDLTDWWCIMAAVRSETFTLGFPGE